MKYLFLIYIDQPLLDALPAGEADAMMRSCIDHADELRRDGRLLDSQKLEETSTATSVRIRNGRLTTTDGPFAETKEHLGGFNVIEAGTLDEAIRIAARFPWARTGCVEVRPIQDMAEVRRSVGAALEPEPAH
jgi:hypothetical protein